MHHGGIYADEVTGKAYDWRILKRFGGAVLPYRGKVAAVLVILPLVAACRLGQPWLIKTAIDRHIVTGRLDGMEQIALLFMGLLLAESLFSYVEVYLLQSVGQRVMSDMRRELYRHVMRLPAAWFDRTPTGSVVTRLTSDVEVLGEMFAAGIITIVGDILLLIGIVSIMLWMNLRLSLVAFTVLPLLLYVAWAFRRNMRRSFREVRSRLGTLNAFLAESIAGMPVIQSFNRQPDEARRFGDLNAAYRNANAPVIFWDASLYAMVEALSSITVALIIWYGGGEIVSGAITFGVLVAFIQYTEKFFTPVRDLSAKYSVMQGAMAALERIYGLLDTPAETGRDNASPLSGVPPTGASPRDPEAARDSSGGISQVPLIEFRDVTFAYRESENALEQFSLTLRRGERIALVGESGGGKTTITRLLTRLYEPDSGTILLDGTDIAAIPPLELRRRIGIVLQDPCLFAGSIAFNICLGDEEAGRRMREAAAMVGADRFIERLPGGYESQVRERGSNLSMGERQLISFCRAVAFDPEILVLDEATASIDPVSEQMIRQGLDGLMAGRTSLVIAHRLSTIRDADRIVVINRGRAAEEGSHRELMDARGLYYRLHQLQFSGR